MNQLLNLRKKAKMTQSQFSALLEVSKQAVCNYEKGIRQPNIRCVTRMIKHLNEKGIECSLSDIYPPEEYKKAS